MWHWFVETGWLYCMLIMGVGHFLDECCEVDAGGAAKSGAVYQEYRNYCMRTGEYTRSTADFYNALETAGFKKQKKRDGVYIIGMRLETVDFMEQKP